MKRVIRDPWPSMRNNVAPFVRNSATLSRIEQVRDTLADRLQEAAAALPYVGMPRNRVKVK